MTQVAVELTDRQKEILKLIREGYTGKEIAAALDISLNTVKSHIADILQRTKAFNATQAVVIAIRCGYIELKGGSLCLIG